MRHGTGCIIGLVGGLALVGTAEGQGIKSVRVASGLVRPLFVTHAPNDFGRIFIAEQRGSGGISNRADIRIMNLPGNTLNGTPFLSISPVSTGSEQGLLGLAFDPNYASTGRFFVNYTNSGGTTVIARYTVSGDPNIANPAGTTILTISQPFSNHNGGWIGFGPDGYLYIATGDGGSGNDPQGNGQNINTLLGKMLRIDVSGAGYTVPVTNPFIVNPPGGAFRTEIWAYGLRNPWRAAFDRMTGDLYTADVGQNAIEEIDFQAASNMNAINYGWRCMEGNNCTGLSGCTCNAPTLTGPIHTYTHAGGNCSVTGGYVYRGCAIPSQNGKYFFADYCSSQIWSFDFNGVSISNLVNRTGELAPGGGLSISSITSFGEDAYGEMYICDSSGGEVFKMLPTTMVGPDCNNNGQRDACDILSGYSTDNNNNGIPDECDCYANCNGDYNQKTMTPILNIADFGCFQTKFALQHPYADCNGDTLFNLADFGCFQTKFALGCP